MFIASVESLMGWRPYRPVDQLGRPRLTATAENENTGRILFEQRYQIKWDSKASRVSLIPHVEKMRHFEPLRKQANQKRSRS